jgi:hypothetical protein
MGRNRVFMSEQLPKTVRELVTIFCSDYWRRVRYIKDDRSKPEVVEKYKEINEKIDKCLEIVEHALRKQFLLDIGEGRGWDRSPLSVCLSRNCYFKHKASIMFEIAKSLNLI